MSDGKYSQISHEYLKFVSSHIFLIISFSRLIYIFPLKKYPDKENHIEIYFLSLYIYIFWIKIRYSWILSKIFVNRNTICQLTILANRNIIHEIKSWRPGVRRSKGFRGSEVKESEIVVNAVGCRKDNRISIKWYQTVLVMQGLTKG